MDMKQYLKFAHEHLSNNKLLAAGVIVCIVITTVSNYFVPRLSQVIIDEGISQRNTHTLIQSIIALFVLNVLNSIIIYIQEHMRAKMAASIKSKMYDNMLTQMLGIETSYLRGRSFTEIYDQIQTDVDVLSSGIGGLIIVIVGEIATIVGGFWGLISISKGMTLLIITFIPIHYCIITALSQSRGRLVSSYIHAESKFAGWLDDTISGINEIKIYGLSRIVRREFQLKQNDLIKSEMILSYHESCKNSTITILYDLVSLCVYAAGAYYCYRNMLTIGSIVAFITYTDYVISPVSILMNVKYNIANVLPSYCRYQEFVEHAHEDDGEECVSEDKNIVFSNISASIDSRQILENISFSINTGEITILAGANGSGKSTILNMLLRFIDPDKGTIFMGGRDVSNMNISEYRSCFSYVGQMPFVFNDSIRKNICLANNVDTVELKRLMDEILGRGFLQNHNLDEVVGDGGAFLSGGEKQMLVFTRAVLQDKEIIVLDEPTANLDCDRKRVVWQWLCKLKESGKTIIIATHDDDLNDNADNILRIQNNTVYQRGKN